MLHNCKPTCDNSQWFVDEGVEPQVWHRDLVFFFFFFLEPVTSKMMVLYRMS